MLISHSLHAQETELYIVCTSHIEFDHLQPQYEILHALKFSLIQVFCNFGIQYHYIYINIDIYIYIYIASFHFSEGNQ